MEENVKSNADTPFTYRELAYIYHEKKDFKNEQRVLKKGIQKCKNNPNPKHVESMKKSLKNVEYYLKHGEFNYRYLSYSDIQEQIKIAKNKIKTGDKETGVTILEKIANTNNESYTVYYTIYKTYLNDKQYSDAIRICDKAIGVLGANEDNKRKWEKYKNKAIQLNEG